MSNDLIVMDNSIVTSAYNLSVNEQRLIYCALKQMPKYDPTNPSKEPLDPKTPFYITRDDFIELGVSPDNVAKEIRQATRELMKKTLFVQTPAGVKQFHWLAEVLRYDRNAEQKLKEKYPHPSDYDKYINALRAYNLLDALPTHKADDNIVARVIFDERVIPLLSDLRASFTQFLLSDVAEFSSIYSYRIYQLLMQYLDKNTGKGWTRIDLDDLRYMLLLLDKYPLTADLKKRVIDVAMTEINEKSPLKAQFELVKKGRKFVAVKFTFELKEKPKTLPSKPKNENKAPDKPDIFDGLSDAERNAIQTRIDEYIHLVESRGEPVSDFYRQNITKKAIAERWGLDVLAKAQEQEQERKERKAKARAEKQAEQERLEQQRQQAELRKSQMVAKFESLPPEQQEYILDEVRKRVGGAFRKTFDEARENHTAHTDTMFSGHFYEFFDF